MKRKNSEVYLPLQWAIRFHEQWIKCEKDGFKLNDCDKLYDYAYTSEELKDFLFKTDGFSRIMDKADVVPISVIKETMSDIDVVSLVEHWSANKQVFALDEDFINELANSETISMTKDMFDYLPYDTFYVDLSANEKVCKEIIGEGFFVRVKKAVAQTANDGKREVYCVRTSRVTNDIFFNDRFYFENNDRVTNVSELPGDNSAKMCLNAEQLLDESKRENQAMNGRLWSLLVTQVLTYLSSIEPDITESAETKNTYRKPSAGAAVKNKYSEIQKWDTGVRFGTAFRAWKYNNDRQSEAKQQAPSDSKKGVRAKQRPHSRRAHWSYFWYGHGDNKIRRPKWVSSYFVNVDKAAQSDTVIHRTESPSK